MLNIVYDVLAALALVGGGVVVAQLVSHLLPDKDTDRISGDW